MLFRPTHARKFIAGAHSSGTSILAPFVTGTMRHLALLIVLITSSCANTDYRFERIDGVEPISMPLKLTGIYGVRDGASVRAEVRFAGGADSGRMNIAIELVPPAEFRSGSYEATIGGQAIEGVVECTSLDYLGGQNARPSIGGVFILKDAQNRPAYRMRIPPTVMAGK